MYEIKMKFNSRYEACQKQSELLTLAGTMGCAVNVIASTLVLTSHDERQLLRLAQFCE